MVWRQNDSIIYLEGYFSEGQANGHARMVYQDGSYYQGHMHNHQMHDTDGQLVKQTLTIKGGFKHDIPHGHCLITYQSGNVYEGEMQTGHRDGYGQFTWQASHEHYQGLWLDNKRHGQGT